MPAPRRVLGLLLLPGLLAACTAGAATGAQPPGSEQPAASGTIEGEVVVLAAASLIDAFEALADDFEQANPDAALTVGFGPSNGLAAQIVEAAPADVFASANQRQMDVVADAGRIAGEPRDFAGNALEIAVEAGNPEGITGLADLAAPGLAVVLAAEEVPAGEFAQEALAAAGVAVTPVSLEEDVRAVLARVELGEADAGIVYRSDIAAAGDAVEGVAIPDDQNVLATYPIATLADAPNPAGAAAFVELVLSAEGQATLRRFGLTPAAR